MKCNIFSIYIYFFFVEENDIFYNWNAYDRSLQVLMSEPGRNFEVFLLEHRFKIPISSMNLKS